MKLKNFSDICASVRCEHGARCENGQCVCPTACPHPNPREKVCGSDGRVYPSKCFMMRNACEKNQRIVDVAAHRCPEGIGPIPPESFEICRCNRAGAYSEVCDRNGRCSCRPGVMGDRCERCMPGYWGLNLILREDRPLVGCIRKFFLLKFLKKFESFFSIFTKIRSSRYPRE